MSFRFLLGSVLVLSSCQSSPGEDQPAMATSAGHAMSHAAAADTTLRGRVMALHDASMLRMDALTLERQRLTKTLAQLDTTTRAGRQQAQQRRHAVRALQAADTRMMDWMHAFQEPDTARLTAHQYHDFWQDQRQQLQQLDQAITTALDSAQALR